ncbi:15715_t:CDS:2 [Gigaspora margarita]|uniref:15715_t:CDS:1 n=1 Tax=Gigaspora margarita TaxID=4874 RepID=A0ABN7UPG4_GIGMA|nr:15715_t:CDS:2 [Gigaspora margarita]
MVSYEPNKNGRQEGSYIGTTAFFDSYAAYRAPPTTKPRSPSQISDLAMTSRYQLDLSQYSYNSHHKHSTYKGSMTNNNLTIDVYAYPDKFTNIIINFKIGTTSNHIYSNSENEGYNSKTYRNVRSFTIPDPSIQFSGLGMSSVPPSPSKVVKQQISVVNPALLSKVSESFRTRITLSNRMKNNLEYKDCFDGREAVDKIAFIIKTTDRNLALLLGRALDFQKFFHDVTYEHRLRDSQNEFYQFKKMPSILSSTDNYEDPEENDLPTGVFTLLTDCYSPTYLSRSASRGSINDRRKDQPLWALTVPPEIANSVSEAEKKRQEAINELIYTEKDFVSDIMYLRECWMLPLLSQNIIPELRREKFVDDVFYNIMEIYHINSKLGDALQKRQNSYAIVGQIGDIFLEYVPKFSPYIEYGAHQLWGKYYFENEKNDNPAFAKFVEDTERLPESRKLELNGYLTKPTTRLGRYPLLLEAILKQTSHGHPDKTSLPLVISLIKDFLSKVNSESGKSENRFNLQQLNDRLISSGSENIDLKLTEEGRQLIYKGSLKKSNETSDIQVFLFDHALLMVKVKIVNKVEQYKIYRRPIPIELLKVSTEESNPCCNSKRTQSILPKSPTISRGNSNHKFPLTFSYLGKKGFTENLYALTLISRNRWIELIKKQKDIIDKANSFEKFEKPFLELNLE